ncbi:hypothetical protein MMC15_006807 [Xylographa vitiligo]|nr:hypothetical protein [Xylographa vitiligo]
MAKGRPSTTQSALPSSSAVPSSTVTASSVATSAVSISAIAFSTLPSPSAALSTITSSAASASTTVLANQVDNQISPGGIAAAAVFGCAILLSCCYLAYLAYRKLQNHRQFQKSFDDQDNAPLADENLATRPMSYLRLGRVPHDDLIEIVVHSPDRPKSADAHVQLPTVLTAGFSPRSTEGTDSPQLSPSAASPTQQALLPTTPRHQRQSTPLLPSRLSSPLPHLPQRNLQRHSDPHRLYSLSPPLPIRHSLHSTPSPRPNNPSAHPLSPTSSTALLMAHPATHGRRPGDVSPGLDPEYPYPMTPAQIGDGRPLSLLGRRGG